MLRRRVVLSEAALQDISEIGYWVEGQASEDVAIRYTRSIRQHIQKLEFGGQRGSIHKDVMPGLRVVGINNATVAFVVTDDRVDILRVFHGGQDWRKALAPDLDENP